jgi:CheY-like chemotaxis protein
VHLAQVDETRARVMLAEGRIIEAEKTARAAVHTLEKGDELSLLAEALTTHGVALARLHRDEQARLSLERAVNVAEQAADFESAGTAALTIIEQLGFNLSNEEVASTLDHAGVLLEKTKDIATLRRLATCAYRGLFLTHTVPAPPDWTNFSFRRAVHRYEEHLIKLALDEKGGMITPAARLLGFKHHQSLISLINSQHKDLLAFRSPKRTRTQSIIRRRNTAGRLRQRKAGKTQTVRILHVEDNTVVANLVTESLESEGWAIETCANGDLALEKIVSHERYDLLLLDNDLPGLSGSELVQRARSLAHRRDTPIVMFSATLDNAGAKQAGADLGLRKPEDIGALTDTIARLLKREKASGRPLVSERQ